MSKYIGEIGLFLTAIIWGSGFVVTSISLDYYSAYQNMAIRFLIGGMVLGLVFFKKIRSITKETIMKGTVLGFILYLAFALQTVGLQYTTPSKNAFLTAVNVVVVPLIGWAIYKKRMDTFEVTGAILALAGIAFLSLQGAGGINAGDVLSFLCAIAFAFHIIYTSLFVKKEDPIHLTVIQMMAASMLGFIVLLFRGEATVPITDSAIFSLVYLGVFATAAAFLLQTVAQQFISETKAAIILSTESFWGMVLSAAILGEIITLKMAIGAAFILLAIFISETKPAFIKTASVREKV
ncbi:DMT family transporter [Siminovitchia sediminis]|uniref:DMT family transporter n=1 Tax=Siminovitchia sediminis TaxID=1274353 RepID=A0ABW4KJ79_9BACI